MEIQFSSAKQIADHNDQIQKVNAVSEAREKAQRQDLQKRQQLESDRFYAQQLIIQERERVETNRYLANRKLSLIAIGIAIASLLVAIFK